MPKLFGDVLCVLREYSFSISLAAQEEIVAASDVKKSRLSIDRSRCVDFKSICYTDFSRYRSSATLVFTELRAQ